RWADSVTVLHQGRVLREGSVTEVQADARVQEVYLGRSAHAAVPGAAMPDAAALGPQRARRSQEGH
ncbi:MAG TPA: hypothetical protein VEQ66_09785, partial [Propionibacteriaceae bacterium]|nr:hypothetical protein [Propionibacteriaceae bacterium]